jgi:hypothetical protein
MDKVKAIQWACYGAAIWFVIVILWISNFGRDFQNQYLLLYLLLIIIVFLLIVAGSSFNNRQILAKKVIGMSLIPGVIFIFINVIKWGFDVSLVNLLLISTFILPQMILTVVAFIFIKPITTEKKRDIRPVLKSESISQLSLKEPLDDNQQVLPLKKVDPENRIINAYKEPELVKFNLQPILPFIDQYIKNQKEPLENLEKFYEYLNLKKFELSPEIKEQIKKKIEEAIENQRNKQREKELGKELFGAPESPASVQPSPAGVLPQASVAPGSACQVCLSEFSSAEPGAVKCPHCGNLFHYRCITKWVNKIHTCPVCKKELKV